MKLESIYSLIKDKIKAVEKRISAELGNEITALDEMGKHISKSGGKKIRPALLCLAASACGYKGNKDVRYAVVFEFVHTATLIHDDIIDHAEIRRGRTVLNRKYDITSAILFGDHLYNSAMNMAIRDDDFRIVRLINDATDKMIGGEIIQARRNFIANLSMDDYMDLIKRKTAYIFASAARAAAILANSGADIEKNLFDYGMNLGIAFQLIDDYFDYAARAQNIGKPVGSDLREGKITYPVLKALEYEKKRVSAIVRNAFRHKPIDDETMNELITIMKETGALDETREKAREYSLKAVDSISSLPDSPYREALINLPEFVVDRKK